MTSGGGSSVLGVQLLSTSGAPAQQARTEH
jgi:hypothetical protein